MTAPLTPVVVPQELWEGPDPGSVANWFFDDGATVREGDLLCEVMIEKVTNEIRSPASGRLQIKAQTETVVHKGDTLALIDAGS